MAQLERGTLVRFNHERDGGPVRRIASVAPDGMVELEDMGGFFAPHLFEIADDIGDIPPKVSTEMSEDFSKATPRPWSVSGVRRRLIDEPVLQILGPDGKTYTAVLYGDGSPKQHAAAHADARLIVAAVNAYREPSEADVKRVAEAMCRRRNTGQCAAICLSRFSTSQCTHQMSVWGQDARAAIAAMRGERK